MADLIMTSDPNPVVPPVVTPPAPVKHTTPPGPGEEGYDPLFDPRTKAQQQQLFSALAKKEAEIAKHKLDLETVQTQISPLQAKIVEYEKAEKVRLEAEMTELQRHKAHLEDSEKEKQAALSSEKKAQQKVKQAEDTLVKERDAWMSERQMLGMLASKGVYPNQYEQVGLFSQVHSLQWTSEQERSEKLASLLQVFLQETNRLQPVQAAPANSGGPPINQAMLEQQHRQTFFQQPIIPPGGQPPMGEQPTIDDGYTFQELREMSVRDPEKYRKVEEARQIRAKAGGNVMIRRVQ